jgi:hypothetical protein
MIKHEVYLFFTEPMYFGRHPNGDVAAREFADRQPDD